MSSSKAFKNMAKYVAKKSIEEPGSIRGVAIPKHYLHHEQLRLEKLRAAMLAYFRSCRDLNREFSSPAEIEQMLGIGADDFDTVLKSLLNSKDIELVNDELIVR